MAEPQVATRPANPLKCSLEPWKLTHIPRQYQIHKCTKSDYFTLLNLFKEFSKYEPVAKDLNMNWEDDVKPLGEYYLNMALNSPAHLPCAYIVYCKATGKPIAMKTNHVSYRDTSKNPKAEVSKPFSPKAQIIASALDALTDRFWMEYPNEQAVFHGDILFIDPMHRGRGLVDAFVDYDVDAQFMINNGFNYAQYELTSIPAKTAAKRFNIKIIGQSPEFLVHDGNKIKLTDGPMALGLHNFHERGTYNAKTHWEKMGLL